MKYLSSSPMTTHKLKKKPDLSMHTKQILWEESKGKYHTTLSSFYLVIKGNYCAKTELVRSGLEFLG